MMEYVPIEKVVDPPSSVDANAEADPGTGANTDPSLAHFHSVECTKSELPCSPYVDGRILCCVH